MNKFLLDDYISVEARGCTQYGNTEVYRCQYKIYDDKSGKLTKNYEVWASSEAVENGKQLLKHPTINEIEEFCKDNLIKRYDQLKGIPKEDAMKIFGDAHIEYGTPDSFK